MKLFLHLALSALALDGATPPKQPLTIAVRVHRLSTAAAQQASPPVLLHGVVTQVMPEWSGFSFQDATDALYISAVSVYPPTLRVGQLVEVAGNTHPGNFAPIVMASNVRVLGTGKMPKPRLADWKFISSGACDNDYIAVDAVVRAVTVVDPPLWRWHATALHLDLGGNLIWAYLRDPSDLPLYRLADADVRISGVCVVLSNSRRQFEHNLLLVSGAPDIQILTAGATLPFSAPLTAIDRLFAFRPASPAIHRVRIRGTVTLIQPDRVFLQAKDNGLLVRTASAEVLKVGEVADAVGYPSPGSYSTVLEDAVIRATGQRGEAIPLPLRAGEVMSRTRDNRPALPDAMLIRVQATVLDVSRSAQEQVMVLQDGTTVFTARMPAASAGLAAVRLDAGSRVSVTGVCTIQVGDPGTARFFEILMRTPGDLRVVKNAPWLTRSRALRAAILLLAIAAGTAIWVGLLRRRVAAQMKTIRQQVERESALGRRLRDLVENASDMVYIRDLEGRLLHVNHGTERLTAYSREELLALNFVDLLSPEQRIDAKQQLAATSLEQQESHFEEAEWKFLRKDGREITVEVKERFLTDGDGNIRVECIGRDITARTLALVDNQERFRTLADNIAQLAWMADETGFIFWFNQRWFDYTGANLEDARGSGWRHWHHPGHVERVAARIDRSFATGEEWEDAFPLRGRDGEYRWFLGRAMPIRDAAGRVVRWFGTNTDISEQKRTETELQRSNDDLRQFAYVASHDLQEPLRNVCTFSELLARSLGAAELTPQRSKYVEIVTTGARRMESLIRDLLEYTRLTGQERPDRQRTDFERVLHDATQNLSASIQESSATVTHDKLPTLLVSASQMSQVLQNLIGNSIKYRRPGIPPKIHLRAERQFDRWLFTLQDNGAGFDPKYAENVFGIFRRLHGPEIPGTGIGLAICKTIVERHGGEMWAEGRPGEGATFYFTVRERN